MFLYYIASAFYFSSFFSFPCLFHRAKWLLKLQFLNVRFHRTQQADCCWKPVQAHHIVHVPAPLLARPLCEPLQCNRKPPKNRKKKQTSAAYRTSEELQGQHNLQLGALQNTRPSPPRLHFSSSETLDQLRCSWKHSLCPWKVRPPDTSESHFPN